jgi:hypothetical protein
MSVDTVQNLEQLLARKSELAARSAAEPEFAARLRELRVWQTDRLTRTYRDLREKPRFAPAVDFFLSDLYGPREFSSRDENLTRAWRYLKRTLPISALEALGRAIELEVLTAELDHAMATALAKEEVAETSYAAAYRTVGQRETRQRQIDLVVVAGESLAGTVRYVLVGPLIRAAHGPAHAAGFGVLQDFIERGYGAFRQMGDARAFLTAIRERETALMEALFAGRSDVYALLETFVAKRS